MRTSLLLAFLVALAACGDSGTTADAHDPSVPDAAPVDAAFDGPSSCRALQDEYPGALAQVGRTCETTMDCALVGGQIQQSCSGVPALGACGGNPINKLAYRSSRAAEIEAEFNAACAGASCLDLSCVADCAPEQNLRCQNHLCVADEQSCLVPPPADAGVSDADVP